MNNEKTLLITLDFPPLVGGVAEYYFNRVKKMNPEEVVVLADGNDLEIGGKIYRRKFFSPLIWPHWLPLLWHIYKITKKENIKELWVGQILPVGTAVWLVSKILHLPYKITCHGNDLLRAKNNPRKFKLAKKILKNARLVEANTEFTKNILVKDFNIPVEKIEIIYPENTLCREMVDEKKVGELRQKYNLNGKKVLLTVARLVESKGIDTVIRILPKAFESIPNLIYIIVGSGIDEQILVNIKKESLSAIAAGLTAAATADKQIIFVGNVLHDDLPNYYALANVFILTPHKTGIDTESFGVVYLEAAEFGLPIIAGDVGGAREALANYDKSFFVDSENKKEIANKIVEILK
jgi:phosphatidylinositol alpha-1,6-mannosyltransferase